MSNTSLIQLIKKISMDAYRASKPCDTLTGKVSSMSPLKVSVGQKMILDEEFLLVGDTVKEKLSTGVKVIMIRQSGGQRFTVIDTISS